MNERQAAQTSARDAVGAALHFSRAQWRFVLILAALGAAASVLVLALGLASSVMALIGVVVNRGVEAFVYAALTAAALSGVATARANWVANGARVWAAMIVVGFFLGIVIFVVSLPVIIVLTAGPLAPYLPDLQAAGTDQAAGMAVMMRFVEENTLTILVVLLFYSAIWLYLTSRLYLAAPATLDQKRVLTFETWAWTKGAVLTIIGARLMLLAPAFLLTYALTYIIGYLVGISPGDPSSVAAAGAARTLFYSAGSALVTFAIYVPLEAALSAAFYRTLRPAEPLRPGL